MFITRPEPQVPASNSRRTTFITIYTFIVLSLYGVLLVKGLSNTRATQFFKREWQSINNFYSTWTQQTMIFILFYQKERFCRKLEFDIHHKCLFRFVYLICFLNFIDETCIGEHPNNSFQSQAKTKFATWITCQIGFIRASTPPELLRNTVDCFFCYSNTWIHIYNHWLQF